MKTLLVLRHAAALDPGSAPTDFDRSLKRRGRADSVSVGEAMRARHLDFDAIIASPARRVVETVAGVFEGSRRPVEPTFDSRAYSASPSTWMEILHDADDEVDRLLIVGHNPTLQELLLQLAADVGDGLRSEVETGYRTATLAELRLAVDHWRDIASGSGRIASLIRPGDFE